MSGVVLGSAALLQSIASANQLTAAAGATISGNAGWFILIATVALVVTILAYIMRGMIHLGR